jgi:hypothetical protein
VQSVCASYDTVYDQSARVARSLRLRGAVLHTTPCIGISMSEALAQQEEGCLLLHYCIVNVREAYQEGAIPCT